MAGFSIKNFSIFLAIKNCKNDAEFRTFCGSRNCRLEKVGLSKSETKNKNFINKITENFEVKDEDIINKVTAISGSGPAYFFLLANHLKMASENLGLTKDESKKLVEKTFLASAMLVKNSDYSTLIKKIASKKGTTEAALKIFKNKNFDKIVSSATFAAYKRAKELSS